MIVGFDGKPLLMQKTGSGVYTDRLIGGLLALDEELEARLYLPTSLEQQLGRRKQKEEYLRLIRASHPERTLIVEKSFLPPRLQRWLWRSTDLQPMETILGDLDIYHATDFVMPPLRRAKGVLTIYDLTFMMFPAFHVKRMQALKDEIMRYVRRADAVIAISEQTKKDLMDVLHLPEERITVTLLAADEGFRVLDDAALVAGVTKKYGIDREYIIYTGTLEPRKNVPTLIKAFALLKQEQKIPHRLVLVGRKGWLYEEIMAAVTTLGVEKEILFLGYVPDADLPALYNGAELFVYPSYYEGFGLPPLEAMACGCPVVTSNRSSLPEVVGDAGIMFDPESVEDLAGAMQRVLTEAGLAGQMRARGLLRSRQFTWKRCARETLEVYRHVTGRTN